MGSGCEVFEIFAGTYEEYLLGYKFIRKEESFKLDQTVADHAHKGSIRAISARGNLLATAGFDEIIYIYSLDDNKQVGTLAQHTGTVTCLAFTSDEKHLISCSEDGSIAIFRVGSWIAEKIWSKAHKNSCVNWIAVHPSNKMALSVGNDGNLRTWNLIDGSAAFVTDISHLSQRPELVVWSESGRLYALPHGNEISVFNIERAKVVNKFKMENKITSCHFTQDEKLCVGDMCGKLMVYNLLTAEAVVEQQLFDARIRVISSHQDHLVVASSNGMIAVYTLKGSRLVELARNNSSQCRITCLTVSCHCHRRERKLKKKKKVEENIKTEINDSNEVKTNSFIQKKMNVDHFPSSKKKSKKRKVECFPKYQTWQVEDQNA